MITDRHIRSARDAESSAAVEVSGCVVRRAVGIRGKAGLGPSMLLVAVAAQARREGLIELLSAEERLPVALDDLPSTHQPKLTALPDGFRRRRRSRMSSQHLGVSL